MLSGHDYTFLVKQPQNGCDLIYILDCLPVALLCCVWDTRFSLLDRVRVAGLSCTKGVWYIYDWDTG